VDVKVVPPTFGMLPVPNAQCIHITTEGRSFLYQQVRSMTGLLVAVGLGNLKVYDVQHIIQSRSRQKAPVAAPSQGLYLKEVVYEDNFREHK